MIFPAQFNFITVVVHDTAVHPRSGKSYDAGVKSLNSPVPIADTVNSTADIIKTLEQKSIDFIEVGIPFSDPMADGPVIQDAATKALRGGMTLKRLFSQLEPLRGEGVKLPLILMGYINPIFHFGYEAFFRRCHINALGLIRPGRDAVPFRPRVFSHRRIDRSLQDPCWTTEII